MVEQTDEGVHPAHEVFDSADEVGHVVEVVSGDEHEVFGLENEFGFTVEARPPRIRS
ncbi:hypothetical protein NXS08_03145 [Gleimia sp. 6138-11-ORH1]|uniref:hypothetical protein n=1 Tax=Gleimia sp. 6138-11-ORH1 TaxID=2973937 RepID=UPI00216A14D4|nr:hypothetical protein [Gleimia sp. 6138-11-ORH1]MCS4484485.1 hypothetical protein [Gleimia sp. 6138-11-ORH1]